MEYKPIIIYRYYNNNSLAVVNFISSMYIKYNTTKMIRQYTAMENWQTCQATNQNWEPHPVPPPPVSLLDGKQEKWQNQDKRVAKLKLEWNNHGQQIYRNIRLRVKCIWRINLAKSLMR